MKKRKIDLIEADKRLFDRMDRFGSNKQLLTILGDFWNTDGKYLTTKGTPQQNKVDELDGFKW